MEVSDRQESVQSMVLASNEKHSHDMYITTQISNDEHEHADLYQTIHDIMPPAAVAAAAVPNLNLPAARDEIIYYGSGIHQQWKHLVDKAEHVVLRNAR
jgi:hypothetical protein